MLVSKRQLSLKYEHSKCIVFESFQLFTIINFNFAHDLSFCCVQLMRPQMDFPSDLTSFAYLGNVLLNRAGVFS
jgi:hypothetical protein